MQKDVSSRQKPSLEDSREPPHEVTEKAHDGSRVRISISTRFTEFDDVVWPIKHDGIQFCPTLATGRSCFCDVRLCAVDHTAISI